MIYFHYTSPQKEFSIYWKSIQQSERRMPYQAISWSGIVKSLKIIENRKGPEGQHGLKDANIDILNLLKLPK